MGMGYVSDARNLRAEDVEEFFDADFKFLLEELDLKEIFPACLIETENAFGKTEGWIKITITPETLPSSQTVFYAVCRSMIAFRKRRGGKVYESLEYRGAYPILVDGCTHETFYFTRGGSYLWNKAKKEGLTLHFRFQKYPETFLKDKSKVEEV